MFVHCSSCLQVVATVVVATSSRAAVATAVVATAVAATKQDDKRKSAGVA
jgi:hypothetical protein